MMIDIQDYTYDLPDDRIARYPLPERDSARLLAYTEGRISHHRFSDLPALLPAGSFLFFNDTRVIPARLHFQKSTGAHIEVFLLQPEEPAEVALAMQSQQKAIWQCSIGNAKRWREEKPLHRELGDLKLSAHLRDRQKGLVEFVWSPARSFAEVVALAGQIPLPPYLHREAEPEDTQRYQTVYSQTPGAVAAPTAGLHFTPRVLEDLAARGLSHDFLTLHVSAGTFQPVKTQNAAAHTMHFEEVLVTQPNIDHLLAGHRFIIAVGTTSARTLESLYWYGVKLIHQPGAPFAISQSDAYTLPQHVAVSDAMQAVLTHMRSRQITTLRGETALYIMPGYRYRVVNGLITNFHQPASTLMLLVAALVGDNWRSIYEAALAGQYRFLSYGDSSLLLPKLSID